MKYEPIDWGHWNQTHTHTHTLVSTFQSEHTHIYRFVCVLTLTSNLWPFLWIRVCALFDWPSHTNTHIYQWWLTIWFGLQLIFVVILGLTDSLMQKNDYLPSFLSFSLTLVAFRLDLVQICFLISLNKSLGEMRSNLFTYIFVVCSSERFVVVCVSAFQREYRFLLITQPFCSEFSFLFVSQREREREGDERGKYSNLASFRFFGNHEVKDQTVNTHALDFSPLFLKRIDF